jgi:hypothetical protein
MTEDAICCDDIHANQQAKAIIMSFWRFLMDVCLKDLFCQTFPKIFQIFVTGLPAKKAVSYVDISQCFDVASLISWCNLHHRRTGRKNLRGQKEICMTFSHCAIFPFFDLSKKIFRANFPKFGMFYNFYNFYIGGRGGGDDEIFGYCIAYFPQYWGNFSYLILYCPTCEANIARLA